MSQREAGASAPTPRFDFGQVRRLEQCSFRPMLTDVRTRWERDRIQMVACDVVPALQCCHCDQLQFDDLTDTHSIDSFLR